MIVLRINAGIYDVHHKGRHFEVERYPDGGWLVFEAAPEGSAKPREYWNDFVSFRAAKAAILKGA